MATVEAVAARLRKLAASAQEQARQKRVNYGFVRPGPKDPEDEAYENLVGQLEETERATLDRLIEKMLPQP
jgi:hypothetical protein